MIPQAVSSQVQEPSADGHGGDMRVVYLDPHPVPDARTESIQILNTVDALAQVGCDVTLATPAPSAGARCEDVLIRPVHPGVRFQVLEDSRDKWWSPSRSRGVFYRAARRFGAELREPAILLVRNLKLADALLDLPRRPPIVFETHEILARTYAEDHPLPGWRERLKLEVSLGTDGMTLTGTETIAWLNGTDAPVEDVDPVRSFYASVTRQDESGRPPGGFDPDQKMTREQALRSYTLNAAYGTFTERDLGSIEVGKLVDFTVLSRDIMTVPDAEILKAQVTHTIVDGKVRYKRSLSAE